MPVLFEAEGVSEVGIEGAEVSAAGAMVRVPGAKEEAGDASAVGETVAKLGRSVGLKLGARDGPAEGPQLGPAVHMGMSVVAT